MPSRASRVACAFLLALGCAEEGTGSATRAVTETSAPTAPAETLEPSPSVGVPTDEPAPPRTIDAPVPEGAGAGLAEAGAALAEAIQAGAAVEGGSACETAYASAIAMIEALRSQTGQAGEGTPPSRDAYLELCNELPPAAQQCLVIGYALEHQEECQSWRRDPRVLALRDRLAR